MKAKKPSRSGMESNGVTIHDIAREIGLSVSTVSRVLSGKKGRYSIREETKRLVEEAARSMNYQPNETARSLRTNRTLTIGLIVPDISNSFFSRIARSIQTRAHQAGYSVILCDTDEDLALEVEHVNLLRNRRVDGMIVMPVGKKESHLRRLVEAGLPLVLIDRTFDDISAHSVVVDNYRGGYMGTNLLLRNGHRRIGLIRGMIDTYTTRHRIRGYEDALKDAGIPVDPTYIVGSDFRERSGYSATMTLLDLQDRPTAILATGNLLALGALRAVYESGRKIPDDVSLVSFDDVEFASMLVCPLTAVAQPLQDMGEAAVGILIEQMESPTTSKPRRIVFTPDLVERASVRSLN